MWTEQGYSLVTGPYPLTPWQQLCCTALSKEGCFMLDLLEMLAADLHQHATIP